MMKLNIGDHRMRDGITKIGIGWKFQIAMGNGHRCFLEFCLDDLP